MKKFFAFLLLAVFAVAQVPSQQHHLIKNSTSGDAPLTLFGSWQGTYGYKTLPLAHDSSTALSDTFSLGFLPSGATVHKAWYVVTDWRPDSTNITVQVGGETVQNDTVFYDADGEFILSTFVYDVTSKSNGADVIASVANLKLSYLSFLYLVYEDPSLPEARIDLFLGSESLKNDSSSVLIQTDQAYQGVKIAVLTEAADSLSSDKENIFLNGNALANDGIFYGNLGKYADYYLIDSLKVQQGLNHIAVQTGQDYLGYHALVYSHHFDAVSALGPPLVHFPKTFELLPNFPNPFNPSTEIRYRLNRPAHVILDIFDIAGRHLHSFDLGKQSSGMQRFIFNAGGLATGVYYYRVTVGDMQKSRRMILLQ